MAELQANAAHYRLLADHAGDVIWVLDVGTGRFTYVSPSVLKLRGYTPDEVSTQTMAEVLTPESLAFVTAELPLRLQQFLAATPVRSPSAMR